MLVVVDLAAFLTWLPPLLFEGVPERSESTQLLRLVSKKFTFSFWWRSSDGFCVRSVRALRDESGSGIRWAFHILTMSCQSWKFNEGVDGRYSRRNKAGCL